MRRAGLLLIVVAAIASGCGSGGHDRASTAATTSTAVARAVFHLTHPLPSAGLALQRGDSIRLVDLTGAEIGIIDGAQVEGWAEHPPRELAVSDGSRHYRVAAGQTTPTVVPAALNEADDSGCHDSDRAGATLTVCNEEGLEPTISLRKASPIRRLTGSPFPRNEVAGWSGFWRWAQLSPDGRWVLAQWSGECEVPYAFLVPTDGGPARMFDRSPIADPTESSALGWSPTGEAVVWLRGGACGTGARVPGIYRAVPGGALHLVVAVGGLGSESVIVTMWSTT